MRRFQFRLERFLELRRWKEREWELKLARALGECLLLENRIREIAEEIGSSRLAAYTEPSAASGGAGLRVDVQAMARRELYVQRLAAESLRCQATLQEKRREMEKVRAKYLEASKERKVLDKVRERREREYYKRQVDEEYKTLDDMNTSAAAVAMEGEGERSQGRLGARP